MCARMFFFTKERKKYEKISEFSLFTENFEEDFVKITMVDVTTINPGTVFAWFMLGMVLRRAILILVFNIGIRGHPFQPGSRVPEDDPNKNKPTSKNAPQPIEYTLDMRVNKVITNDAENDTYFLILLLATAVFTDTLSGNTTRTIVYGVIYLVIRIIYAFMYIMGLQPWRTIVFAMGITCTVACNLDLVISMSRRSN
jgi:glutathione S-transferase